MNDEIRKRMKLALEMKKLDHYQVSENAGYNRNYLWESFKRNKGSLDGYKKIADKIDLNYLWLVEEKGEPFPSNETILPIDRQSVIVAIEVLLERLGLDRPKAVDVALKILDILEHPPDDDGSSAINKSGRIRSAILGALRIYGI